VIKLENTKINVVPAKETNSLRDKVKDAVKKELKHFGENIDDGLACDMADAIFDTLGISEDDQDIEGAKVVVDKPFCVMCPKCEHGFMTDESLEGK